MSHVLLCQCGCMCCSRQNVISEMSNVNIRFQAGKQPYGRRMTDIEARVGPACIINHFPCTRGFLANSKIIVLTFDPFKYSNRVCCDRVR